MVDIPFDRVKSLGALLGRDLGVHVDSDNDLASQDIVAAAVRNIIQKDSLPETWIALSLLSGRLPDDHLVAETTNNLHTEPNSLYFAAANHTSPESAAAPIRIVQSGVIVDVAYTVSAPFATGIERVVRECAKRWDANPDCLFVAWTKDQDALRTLTPYEYHQLISGDSDDNLDNDINKCEIVVPWGARYFVPEFAGSPERSKRIRAISKFSPNFVGEIGHDVIPFTTAETVVSEMPNNFALLMTAMQDADLIVATCNSSAREFRGWRAMLEPSGKIGPQIKVAFLPVEAGVVSDSVLKQEALRLPNNGAPTALVVGSHDPRKNHQAILYAAEQLWQEGIDFNLVFIGGNSWNSEGFFDEAERLKKLGRPITLIQRASEELLWSAYKLATFTIFPSLNEGFGLPVAESLAVGTPVITSEFGSMAEIAKDGGCLLVNPRSDQSIADAMRLMVTDNDLVAKLAEQAKNRPERTWDQYAAEVWNLVVSTRSAK